MDFDCEPEDSIEILKRYFKHSDRIYSFNIGTSYKFYTLGVCHCDPDKDHLYVSRRSSTSILATRASSCAARP